MNVLIANSNIKKTNNLIELLLKFDAKINVLGCTSTVLETQKLIAQKAAGIDLIFLEALISEGLAIDNRTSSTIPIVFTSSNKEHAYKAIKEGGLDFVLEPFKQEEVSTTLVKAQLYINSNRATNTNYKKRFIIKFGDKIQFKTTDDIGYIFAEGKIAFIVTRSTNRKYIIEHTLDELEKKHLNPLNFYRINRKFIVNIDAIEEARNYVNSRLKLILNPATDFDLVVSREKVHHFKNWLNL